VAAFCAFVAVALAAEETKTEQVAQERSSSSDDLQTAAAGEGRSKSFFF